MFAITLKRKIELVALLLLCFYCLADVLLLYMFCVSSSQCHRLVCGLSLWYFLTILTTFFYMHAYVVVMVYGSVGRGNQSNRSLNSFVENELLYLFLLQCV